MIILYKFNSWRDWKMILTVYKKNGSEKEYDNIIRVMSSEENALTIATSRSVKQIPLDDVKEWIIADL